MKFYRPFPLVLLVKVSYELGRAQGTGVQEGKGLIIKAVCFVLKGNIILRVSLYWKAVFGGKFCTMVCVGGKQRNVQRGSGVPTEHLFYNRAVRLNNNFLFSFLPTDNSQSFLYADNQLTLYIEKMYVYF